MVKRRLIPVVLLKNGSSVQSKRFVRHQRLGNPSTVVDRLSGWAADELVYLDISRQPTYDLGRDDLCEANRDSILPILKDVAQKCFMPLTFGGGIRSLHDIEARVTLGADKVTLNTQAIRTPALITEAAKEFGSQCIVASIDVRREGDGWMVYADGGREETGLDIREWAREVEARGAGEIFLNSIDRDGSGDGYDIELINTVCDAVSIPIIACGGVGTWEHLAEALRQTPVSGIAAANIFNYTENSVFHAKTYLYDQRHNIRPPTMESTVL